MTAVPDLSENLRRAFEHELARGNTVARVDRPAGTRCPLAVVFAQPLDIVWFKASEPLTTAVKIWENHDSHYPMEAGYICDTTRHAMSGPVA